LGNETKDEIEIIREVFTYINRFKNAIFVIKIDADVIDDTYFPVLLNDLATLHSAGIRIIIIPGARKQINEVLEQYGIHSGFSNGIRITTEEAIPFVKMAAFDVSNKIMTGLAGLQKDALVGNWIRAKGIGVIDGIDYGYSGKVDRVLLKPLSKVLEESFIPIIPVIGWNSVGRSYNLSSSELALRIAEAVHAEKLFFITSEETLNVKDFVIPLSAVAAPDGRISRMDQEAAEKFITLNSEKKVSLRTFKEALDGIRRGVRRAHIINSRGEKGILAEIFSNLGVGTMIYKNEFDRIRAMKTDDIPDVLRLMQPLVQDGILIPRDKQTLQAECDTFVVYEIDERIHGCASLQEFDEGVGEIAAVAVDSEYEKLGLGGKLISFLMKKARERKLKKLFLLTTRTADWFESRGFHPGSLDDLPGKKRSLYNFKRNSLIMVMDLNK